MVGRGGKKREASFFVCLCVCVFLNINKNFVLVVCLNTFFLFQHVFLFWFGGF